MYRQCVVKINKCRITDNTKKDKCRSTDSTKYTNAEASGMCTKIKKFDLPTTLRKTNAEAWTMCIKINKNRITDN